MNTVAKRSFLRWLLPVLAIGGLLLIIAAMAGVFSDRIEPDTLHGPENPSSFREGDYRVGLVEVELMEPVPAVVGAREATTISSRTLARITEMNVRAGDTVEQGQVLVQLERSDLESRLAQARQQVIAIEARLMEARQNLQRAEQLRERELVAAATLDEARATHDSLSAQLASGQQEVREAEVALEYSVIRAPIDGRVVERFAEPGDTASPGEPLLSLYNPASIRIEAGVRESLALPLVMGQALRVEIPATDRVLEARIEELVPAADPGSRSFMVKAQVEQAGLLMPGMYARMLIPAGRKEVRVIPRAYVVPYGQLDIVWVRSEDQLDRRFLRIGKELGPGLLEVISGLEADEIIALPPATPDSD